MLVRRRTVLAAAATPLLPAAAGVVRFAAPADDDRWNACIAWAGERMQMLHGVRVRHLRGAADAADLVSVPAAALSPGLRALGSWRVRGWVAVHDPARRTQRMAEAATLADARALFARGETDRYVARNPGEAACGIARSVLPAGTRTTPLAAFGSDVLALASPSPGAVLFARFLLSAEAQAHFCDPLHCAAPRLTATAA